jgi:CRP-like cAMP-binding protein
LSPEGRELTTDLIPEGDFIAPYSDQIQNKPASLYIEALEDSVVATFDFQTLRRLTTQSFEWNRLALKVTELLYIGKEKRELFLLSYSGIKKISYFREEHPELEKRVPRQVLASYLGMNASTLSRLLSK